VGFAAVALFASSANQLEHVIGLGPLAVGFLVAVPSLSGSLLRIPFSAWVDTSGGRKPYLWLLGLSVAGMTGLTLLVPGLIGGGPHIALIERYHLLMEGFLDPAGSPWLTYGLLMALGALSGCGIATFSVGISQVSYWFPRSQQGRALAIFAGVGNLAPGIFSLLLPFALGSVGLPGSYVIWLMILVAGTACYAAMGRNSPYFQFLQQGLPPEQARDSACQLGQELFPAGNLRQSLANSARVWRTWALVWIYFTTFGGFIALTAWLPTYWHRYFDASIVTAGLLTAAFSILASLVRVAGGVLSDRLYEGGENTTILGLFITMVGALVMTTSHQFELSVPGELLLALGMGVCNASVFKMVPQAVPQAVGGAAGWVGGLGAFGGFVIPPVMAFAVSDLGSAGYAIGFITFVFLSLFSLSMAWVLKYAREDQPKVQQAAPSNVAQGQEQQVAAHR
jgi:NNP family nitrate/nitrite transporter-like MFS transporter